MWLRLTMLTGVLAVSCSALHPLRPLGSTRAPSRLVTRVMKVPMKVDTKMTAQVAEVRKPPLMESLATTAAAALITTVASVRGDAQGTGW